MEIVPVPKKKQIDPNKWFPITGIFFKMEPLEMEITDPQHHKIE